MLNPLKPKREMNKVNLLFISFAAIFGSGWLFAPLYAAQIAGPYSLVAWAFGALMSAVIGMTMAEVVVLFPKTGGLTHIARVTHGNFLSLVVTLFNLLVFLILPAIEVRAVLQYLSSYHPLFLGSENSISLAGQVLACLLLAGITLVNLYGAKVTASLTQGVVIFKMITPLLLCFSFLYVLSSTGSLDHSRILDSHHAFSWTAIFKAIATSGIIFSFNGFNQATLFAGEAKNPQRAIPFAILGSLLITGLLYLLIQYVFLMAVPVESFSQGWDKLAFSGDAGPFAGIAALLGLGWLLTVIYADAIVSPLGTAFAFASAAPRLFMSLFENTPLLKSRLFKINRYGISSTLVLTTWILECFAFLFLPSLKAMISILVAAFVLCYTIAPASLLVLRKTRPNLPRPFRIHLAPVVSYFSLLFSNLMVFSCGWIALRNLICLSLVLVAVYAIVPLRKRQLFSSLRGSGWFILQLTCIGALCYWDHLHPLNFSQILIGMGLTSLVALGLSQRDRAKF